MAMLDRAVLVRVLAGDIVLCSWARHSTLHSGAYKCMVANLMLGVTLRRTSNLFRLESRNIPSGFMPLKPETSTDLMFHGSCADLTV